jgi:hypothetical protein
MSAFITEPCIDLVLSLRYHALAKCNNQAYRHLSRYPFKIYKMTHSAALDGFVLNQVRVFRDNIQSLGIALMC